MKIKRILIIGLALLLIAVTLPISVMFSAAEQSTTVGILTDGSVEKGTALFGTFSGRKKDDNAFDGDYLINCNGKTCSKTVKLQPGLKYKLSFWYLNPTAEETDLFGVTSDISTPLSSRRVDYYVTLGEAADWKYASLEFTASKTDYMLYVGGTVQIDAVTLAFEKSQGILENGSFEEGMTGWSSNTADELIATGNASNGFVYASLPVNKKGGIYYDFNVTRGTNYTVSFDYLGGGTNSAYAITKTSGTVLLDNAVSEIKGFTTSSVWTNTSLTFNSGNSSKLRLFVRSGEYGTLAVDSFKIKVADASNKVLNGEFITDIDKWSVSGTAPEASDVTSTGDNSLKFATAEGTVYQKLTVEKNKDYKITFNRVGVVSWAISKGILSAPEFTGDNVIIGSSLAKNDSFVKESFGFNSGDNDSLLIAFKGSSADILSAVDDICIYENAFNTDDSLILKNGGFENGLDGWSQRWVSSQFTITDKSASGENALFITGGGYAKIAKSFKVEKGKSYRVAFSYSGTFSYNKWSVTSGGDANKFNTDEGTTGYVIGGMLTQSNMTTYAKYISDIFTAEEDGTYYYNIASNTATNIAGLIDDIFIFEINGDSLVVNGDFDGVISPWSCDESVFEQVMGGYNGSLAALKATKAYYSKASQMVKVEPDTNYELTFMYKGNPSAGVSSFAVSTDGTFSDAAVLSKGVLTASNEWNQASTVVNSGELGNLYIVFQTSNEGEYIIDDVSFKKTDKAASPKASLTPAYFGGTTSAYSTDKDNNVIQNGDFEGAQSGSKPDAMSLKNSNTSIVDERFGKALKLEAGPAGAITLLPLGLKKNTEYYISLYVKTPKMDDNNSCDVSFGIADIDTGDFIITANPDSEGNRLWKPNRQLIPTAADNKWHMTCAVFNTNDSEKLAFMIRGTNATVYIDNISIFTPENGVLWENDFNKLSDVVITDEDPALLGTKTKEDNIVNNFDFESADLSDWSSARGTVYGDTLHIADSKSSIYEKTFRYSANKRYPQNIYYIKWIDVEPNTEYTFSAKCSLTKVGGGYFGLISGYKNGKDVSEFNENLKHPTVIKQFEFDEDAFLENCEWQSIGVSFNTGDRNRVGIAVFDGGGEAYIDEIRLFKTSAAAELPTVEDDFPKTLVASDLELNSGKVYLSAGEKLSDVIKEFDNSHYLRVYAVDGTEIEDTSASVATGMEIRLMDGPVIKDRATVIVRGDVNGDGKANTEDKAVSLKHISKEEVLTDDNYVLAADFDGDGNVTVYDLNHTRKAATKGEAKLRFEGPKTFAAGEDIEVSLIIDSKNVKAINGILKFDNSLSFKSAAVELDGWEISTLKHGDSLYFAASDLSEKNPAVGGKAVVTFTLTVGDVKTYSEVQFFLTELFAATEKSLLTTKDIIWTPVEKAVEQAPVIPDAPVVGDGTVETVVENVKLSMLKLDEAEISPAFDPEIKEYTANVPFSVKKVTVTAIAADENAMVEIGDTNLEYVGKNMVKVVVTTANGSKATYRIVVVRGAPEKTNKVDKSVESGFSLLWIIIPIIAVVVIAGIALLIILLAKKRKK